MKKFSFLLLVAAFAFAAALVQCPEASGANAPPDSSQVTVTAGPQITVSDPMIITDVPPSVDTPNPPPVSALDPVSIPAKDPNGILGLGWPYVEWWLLVIMTAAWLLVPTEKRNIIGWVVKVFRILEYTVGLIIPNRKKGGGVHTPNIFYKNMGD